METERVRGTTRAHQMSLEHLNLLTKQLGSVLVLFRSRLRLAQTLLRIL